MFRTFVPLDESYSFDVGEKSGDKKAAIKSDDKKAAIKSGDKKVAKKRKCNMRKFLTLW